MLRLVGLIALTMALIAIPYPVEEGSFIAYFIAISLFPFAAPARGLRTSAKEIIWTVGVIPLSCVAFLPWYTPLALTAKAVALLLMLILFVLTTP
jgi:hypothetical protein